MIRLTGATSRPSGSLPSRNCSTTFFTILVAERRGTHRTSSKSGVVVFLGIHHKVFFMAIFIAQRNQVPSSPLTT